MNKKQNKLDYLSPIKISEDVWFYPNKKSFDFVISVMAGDKRVITEFRLTHRKIKKFLTNGK